MKMDEVLLKVKKDISLSVDELKSLDKKAKDIVSKLKKVGLTAYIGGSLAKETLVKKKIQDVDIFILFKEEGEIKHFKSKLNLANLGGEFKEIHGSRDYYQVIYPDVKIELIPTVEVTSPEDAKNVTDVSLLHVKYVVSNIKKNPNLAGEIKLAKVFCSAQKCYGAESYINGFSGYSLEVLVIYFGGFVNFLKGVGKKRVIDSDKHFLNEKQVLFEINSSKLQGPLVVVDPTYKFRNITAGLGKETYEKFLKVKHEFLKKPSEEFFVEKSIDLDELKSYAKKSKAKLIKVEIKSDRQEGDIVGTKCKKFLNFFIVELEKNGQEVILKRFEYSGSGQKADGYLIVKENLCVEKRGPLATLKDASNAFRRANKGVYEKKGCLWIKRAVTIHKVFNYANRVKNEMGSWGENLEVIENLGK